MYQTFRKITDGPQFARILIFDHISLNTCSLGFSINMGAMLVGLEQRCQ
jgi:hypothetical protein